MSHIAVYPLLAGGNLIGYGLGLHSLDTARAAAYFNATALFVHGVLTYLWRTR
jgi:hypothetical protein